MMIVVCLRDLNHCGQAIATEVGETCQFARKTYRSQQA